MRFRDRAEIHSRLGTEGGDAEAEAIDDRSLPTFISTSNMLDYFILMLCSRNVQRDS